MDIIKSLKNITSKKEFKSQLIDLIFKEAKNNEEAGNNKYIQIPNSVTSVENWSFDNSNSLICNSLTCITIPSSVISIGIGAFYNCNSLTYVNIPSSVTFLGNCAFSNCNSLTSITLPNSELEIGDKAFEYCNSLTSVTIPNSVTSIGDDVFDNCNSLTCITIPKIFETDIEDILYSLDLFQVKIIYT